MINWNCSSFVFSKNGVHITNFYFFIIGTFNEFGVNIKILFCDKCSLWKWIDKNAVLILSYQTKLLSFRLPIIVSFSLGSGLLTFYPILVIRSAQKNNLQVDTIKIYTREEFPGKWWCRWQLLTYVTFHEQKRNFGNL